MDLLSLLNIIPGAQTAVAQLQSKIGDFLKVPSRIQNDQTRVSKLLPIAQTNKDTTGISELGTVQSSLPNLMNLYNNTLPMVQQVSGQAGGGISTDLLSNATSLIADVASLIASVDQAESVLSNYEKKYSGQLKSFGISSLMPSTSSILWIGGLGAVLVIVYFLTGRRRS